MKLTELNSEIHFVFVSNIPIDTSDAVIGSASLASFLFPVKLKNPRKLLRSR
jgi:hypothetical protein